jgi:hypothetical protein
MVISQNRLDFGMKRNWKIQGEMGCNGLGSRCSNQKRIRRIFGSPQRDLALRPGTPSAHGNWRARDDSNTRTLPQEPPPTSKPSKIRPVAAGRGFVY